MRPGRGEESGEEAYASSLKALRIPVVRGGGECLRWDFGLGRERYPYGLFRRPKGGKFS